MSMNNSLLIPSTILVGFQKRSDTFTGKLAYVIYKDHTGKIRKEASWNSWRSHDIETLELPNDPQQGFTFNKGVKRDGYWGNGRSVIRVWDPRDFEFEISVDNLVGVLMHSDVSKRDIVEKCVFAWNGTELVLLPVNSVEFTESTKHTEKQSQKISARDLKIGATYTIKKENTQVVYLGRYDRYSIESIYFNRRYGGTKAYEHKQKKSKGHVFINPTTLAIEVRDPTTYLAYLDTDESHPNYASFMEHYYKSAETQPIIGLQVNNSADRSYYSRGWRQIGDNEFMKFSWTDGEYNYNSRERAPGRYTVDHFARWNADTNQVELSHKGTDRQRHYYYNSDDIIPKTDLPGMSESRVDVVSFLQQLTDEYREGLKSCFVSTPQNYDYQREAEEKRALQSKLMDKYDVGHLHYVMKNGKLSNEQIY